MRTGGRRTALLATVALLGVGLVWWMLLGTHPEPHAADRESVQGNDQPTEGPTLRAAPFAPPAAAGGGSHENLLQEPRGPSGTPMAAGKPWRSAGTTRDAVTADLRIRVVDGQGRPRESAEVSVSAMKAGELLSYFQGAVDRDGRVLLHSLPPGRLVVSATLDGLRRSVVPELVAGQVTELDLLLPRGVPVEGHVRHTQLGVLAEIDLTLEPLQAPKEDWGGWSDTLRTKTDGGGKYRLEEVPAGRWVLSLYGGPLGPVPRHRASLTIDGSGPVVHDVVVGRVTLRGTVRDGSTGAPVPSAKIQIQGDALSATTAANGAFSFPDVPPGTWTLSARADGFGHRFVKVTIPESDLETATLDVALQPAGALLLTLRDGGGSPVIGDLLLVLHSDDKGATGLSVGLTTDEHGECAFRSVVPATYVVEVMKDGYKAATRRCDVRLGENAVELVLVPATTTQGPRLPAIHGVIYDARTRLPVPGATVRIPTIDRSSMSDGTGRYALTGLAPAPWTFQVAKDGFGFRTVAVPPLGADEDREIDVFLDPAATLRLHLLGRDGKPVSGDVRLTARPTENSEGARTTALLRCDANGNAAFRQILPGRYRLRLTQEGTGSAETEVLISLGDNQVDARLE